MEKEKETPKHSVGKGAQNEKYNTVEGQSYVENPKEKEFRDTSEDDDYLERKWKKISSDFRKKYNMDTSESEYNDSSFSEVLKNLENKTGKSRTTLEKEIEEWKNS